MKPPFKGISIDNLYNNISSGKYSPIPYIYYEELGKLISMIIVVDMRKKGNIDDLIHFPFVKKRIKEFYEDGKKALLIRTIKIPKNIRDINEKWYFKIRRFRSIKNNKNELDSFSNWYSLLLCS